MRSPVRSGVLARWRGARGGVPAERNAPAPDEVAQPQDRPATPRIRILFWDSTKGRIRTVRRRPELGAGFRRLWSASAISTLGDGIQSAGLPLLAAHLSRDPLKVGLVMVAQSAPWLLIGVFSGVLVDRWNRIRLMWMVDVARMVVVSGLAVAALLDALSIATLVCAGLVLGVGQTLFDTASQASIPELVGRDRHQLERANARLLGAQTFNEQLAGPPAGSALFVLHASVPFLANAVSFGASAVLLRGVGRATVPARQQCGNRSILAELHEGLSWLWRHRLLRTLALIVATTNLSFNAGEAILVLFAQERLGLGEYGFGLLLTSLAFGGLAGAAVATWVSSRVGSARTLTAMLFLIAGSRIGIAITGSPLVGAAMLVLTGMALTAFNVVGQSVRQTLVPDRLLGRVISTYRLLAFSTIPVGGVVGGLLARQFSVQTPFLVGGAAVAVAAVLASVTITNRTIDGSVAAR